jgi:hypothetical protein
MTEGRKMDAEQIAAQVEISGLMGRYVQAVDGGPLEALAALFASDGQLVVHDGRAFRGHDAILAFLRESRASRGAIPGGGPLRHHVASACVEVNGDRAMATSYFTAVTLRGPDHWGVYRDHFAREAGVWRFAERSVTIEGAAPEGWIGSGAAAVRF